MAVSRVDLANQALAHLSRDTLRDLDGTSPAAVQTKAHIQAAIEEVIEEYDWPQCRVIKQLTAVDIAELRGWTYAYAVPSDSVFIWGLTDLVDNAVTKFEIGMSPDPDSDTLYIFADAPGLSVRYGSRRASLTRFSPQTIALMGMRLAIKVCMPLTKDKVLKRELERAYKLEVSAVKTRMANMEPELIDVEFVPETISVRSA